MLDEKDDLDTYSSLIFLRQKEIINFTANVLKDRRFKWQN